MTIEYIMLVCDTFIVLFLIMPPGTIVPMGAYCFYCVLNCHFSTQYLKFGASYLGYIQT